MEMTQAINTNFLFSVIISTYNRLDLLRKSIESVLEQTYARFELIVADDASDKDPKFLIDSFEDSRIVYIRNEDNCGISATRNLALKKSHGDYILLMDDDTILKSDFLEILNKIVISGKIGALCPKILAPVTKDPFIPFFRCNQKKYLNKFSFNCFIGLAHVISKEALGKVGYYDERFGVGAKYYSSEESDYFFRLKKTGEKILYYPDLVAYHPQEVNPSEDKVFKYSYGISAMLIKNFISDIAHGWDYFLIFMRRLVVSLLRTCQYAFFPASLKFKNKQYKYKYFFLGSLWGIAGYLRGR